MRNTVFCFSFIVLIFGSPFFVSAEESRTWKDESGLFSIEASLQQIDGGHDGIWCFAGLAYTASAEAPLATSMALSDNL